MNLTRDQARHELSFFDGLRQMHMARLMANQTVSWPEVEAAETDRLKREIAEAFT